MSQTPALQTHTLVSPTLSVLYAPRTLKLITMGITTLGLYQVYWGYRNWQTMKYSKRTEAWVPICGFFIPFTLFSLLYKIEPEARAIGIKTSRLRLAAIGFLLINLFKMIPILGILALPIAPLVMIPINNGFRRINAAQRHPETEDESFTLLNVIWLAIVAAWFTFGIIREITGRV